MNSKEKIEEKELAEKLMPLIIQDFETKQVLSLFYSNDESIRQMRETGFVWRFSRSQQKQMKKGEASGNVQKIRELLYDCDRDALLAIVQQEGTGACHLNRWSCFAEKKMRSWGVLDELCDVIADRKKNPKECSFVSSIICKPKAIGEKLREEAEELEEALLKKPDKEVIWEAADLLFFILVALENRGIDVGEVIQELKRRRKSKIVTYVPKMEHL